MGRRRSPWRPDWPKNSHPARQGRQRGCKSASRVLATAPWLRLSRSAPRDVLRSPAFCSGEQNQAGLTEDHRHPCRPATMPSGREVRDHASPEGPWDPQMPHGVAYLRGLFLLAVPPARAEWTARRTYSPAPATLLPRLLGGSAPAAAGRHADGARTDRCLAKFQGKAGRCGPVSSGSSP